MKRNFDHVSVDAMGVQSCFDRFGKRRRYDDEGGPQISPWRCNLSGLSQTRNLYFIAYGRDIHVYEPRFPTQAISEKSILSFTSQPSSQRLRGYLDPRNPHAINSLLVQHLGNEEVVAVVRDDGDVDVFLVRHIAQAIERRRESAHALTGTADDVKPIFQENVERSAWGLAIHSNARILATSSNKHEVRIFKFGLIEEESTTNQELSQSGDSSKDEYSPRPSPYAKTSRDQDVTLHVINGNSNIPYIAFCNTGDDTEGRWLLTTDIEGFCRVMDLQESIASQTFRFGQSFAGHGVGGLDRFNAGWTVMFLDRRSFLPVQSSKAALGMQEDDPPPDVRDDARIWDISKTAKHVPDASAPFVFNTPRQSRQDQRILDIRSPSGRSVTSSATESRDSTRPSTSSDSQDHSMNIEIDLDMSEHDAASDEDEGGVQIEVEHDTEGDGNMTIAAQTNGADGDTSSEEDQFLVNVVDDYDDPDDEGTEDTVAFTAFYNGDSVCGNEPRFARLADSGGTLCEDLPCPILHASIRNVYLLQPSNQSIRPGPWVPPMIGAANPLRQGIQQEFEYLRNFERLNMSAQIPALGIVVVASQKGRALILGLTKFATNAEDSDGMRGSASQEKHTTYGIRIESIVPFAAQERANQRPFAPLHGLSVGPLQGSEDLEPERKRWRLMLLYQDHSILSYEISRKERRERDAEVNVETLVV